MALFEPFLLGIHLSEDFSFKPFSSQPFFRRVNAWLLDHAQLDRGWRVVDVACGSGLVTELIVERIQGATDTMVVALDVSAAALRETADRLAATAGAAVQCVQARAEEMSTVVKSEMDAVIFCNGIHYVRDKHRLVQEVHRVLRPGGVFAFNTSFFKGAQLPETQGFYRRWMIRALRILKDRHGTVPQREKVESRLQLTPEEYRQAVEAGGFRVTVEELVPETLEESGWIDISRFGDFVGGVLPGVPLEQASDALCDAVRQTFAEMNLTGVPRNWLSVVAVRA